MKHTFLLLWLTLVAAAADSTSSTTTYESVRALDRSGQALQLKHAQAAADEQGRLIIACRCNNNNSVLIASPLPLHHHRRSPESLTHRIWARSTDDDNNNTYVTCTGVQADAAWLIRQLQTYGKIVTQKHHSATAASTAAVAQAAAALNRLLFWGYDNSDTTSSNSRAKNNNAASLWQSSVQQAWQGQERWGRPVGVRTLVIAPRANNNSNNNNNSDGFRLQIVEPSGVIVERDASCCCCCLGQQSSLIQAKLEELLQSTNKDNAKPLLVDEDDVQELVRRALEATLVTPPAQMQVEIISRNGEVTQKTWSFAASDL